KVTVNEGAATRGIQQPAGPADYRGSRRVQGSGGRVPVMSATLVTGAAGFIGSHLVGSLLADGERGVGGHHFDPFYHAATKRGNLRTALDHPNYVFVEADIRDPTVMQALLEGYRVTRIAHLAARAGVRPSIRDPLGYIDANVNGTASLLSA